MEIFSGWLCAQTSVGIEHIKDVIEDTEPSEGWSGNKFITIHARHTVILGRNAERS